ncbi:DUF5320 family protein [Patescibacteria group bacterium]|nr:DUF5320 family protein [Patescibacteria group bacterium]MBU1885068.1 DUF5320 family protein [Patescibacteria group bacterium]
MPNLDGTGPSGQGPRTGRGAGRGCGLGQGNRPLGSNVCTCPKCGHEESHQRGNPCSQTNCPKCQTPMKGVNCL